MELNHRIVNGAGVGKGKNPTLNTMEKMVSNKYSVRPKTKTMES